MTSRRIASVAILMAWMATAADAAPVLVGQVAPNFSLMDASGTTYTLSGFRGQVVLLGLIGYG